MITDSASWKGQASGGASPGVRGSLQFRCVACGCAPLSDPASTPAAFSCPHCGHAVMKSNGILRALTADRERHYWRFVRDYEAIRAREGRGSKSSEYYLALPFRDVTGHNRWQWQIRARTFAYLERRILPEIERSLRTRVECLDLGAGNCWLSYRLALRGHRLVAVDLIDNEDDGLGAGQHYLSCLRHPFLRVQAEMDNLPFASAQFDVVIFNASFHYSVDYRRTLAEAVRCLRPSGHVIIADSPFYSCEESGRRMVEEKHAQFERQFGFRSDNLPSREYLTHDCLNELARSLSVQWRINKPWYGAGWALRPWKARLQRRREPAKFYLITGRVGRP